MTKKKFHLLFSSTVDDIN